MSKNYVKGKKVSILGGGLSGISVSLLLHNRGANVFLSEIENTKEKLNEFKVFQEKNIDYELGKHSPEKILNADMIIISPGLSSDIPIVKEAIKQNIPIYSEIEVASWFCDSPIVAVTGTNGKSTTVSLLGEMFSRQGIDNVVAGNIGKPFSNVADETKKEEIVILEISSFQLERICHFHPKVSILLNVTFDHMDRYRNFDEYVKTKINITKNQTKNDFYIFNIDDEYIEKFSKNLDVSLIPISIKEKFETGIYVENSKIIFSKNDLKEEIINIDEMSLKGEHNIYNCMAVIGAVKIFSVKNEKISETLKSFKGLEHRFEFVDSINGVNFINDSKATNVDSVYYALKSLKNNVILLAGGRDKKGDLSPLNQLIKEKVKTLVLLGEAALRMQKEWNHLPPTIIMANSFYDAFNKAWSSAEKGDCILLSPACASFDMFKNFEERGECFKELVRKLKKKYE
jgi:UDP-N-acetylmuramoylalanine--D-glutamate ligase